MSFVDGLSSGLDTSGIINSLMQIERRPQAALTSRRSQEEEARTELTEIRTEVSSLRSQAADLRLTSGWNQLVASSSNDTAVTVEATSATTTGSYSFEVTSVATAASVYSTQTFASVDDNIGATPGATVFNASGYESLGFSGLTATGFDEGAISFEVVQASARGEVNGAGIPLIPIEVDGTNDNIDFEVNGFSFSITLAHGNYESSQEIVDAVVAAIADEPAAAAVATASLNDDDGVTLSTIAEGSDHTITITGGTALADLGLTTGFGVGTDGIVEVDGIQTAITDSTAGSVVTLASAGAGTIDATVSGPIREGTAATSQDGFGSGSLADMVDAINSSDLGYSAAAVNTGAGYRLQLTADETGAGSAFTPDPAIFGAVGFTVLSAGTDAELTIQGENPFTIVSSTNSFNDLVPGANITVNSVTTAPVTVSTERDVESVTEKVGELVTKLNDILSRIATSTANQPDGVRSVLQGSREARRAADQLRNSLVAPIDSNEFGSVGLIGIELTREGALTFNQDTFKEALLDNPDSMTALFSTVSDNETEPGVLDRLVEAAEAASSAGGGYLYTATQSSERRIDDYGRQIDAFERRFEVKESSLRRTYANLEVALGGLQNQSGNLASQLSQLGGGAG